VSSIQAPIHQQSASRAHKTGERETERIGLATVGIGGAARPGMESSEFCVVGWVYRWDGEQGRGPRKKHFGGRIDVALETVLEAPLKY
jgi:hypothetical protein